MKTKMSDRLLAAAALTVALGVAYPCAAQQQLVFSGFPGVIGNTIKKSFIETYDRANTIRYLESWDSARFTQMQANRANPKEDVVTFTDLTLGVYSESWAEDYSLTRTFGAEVPLLGQIPLDPRLRECGDAGKPLVLEFPDSPAAKVLSDVAKKISVKARGLAGKLLSVSPAGR